MGRRYAAKVDSNQSPIVSGLRAIFGPDCVFDLSSVGGGCPDLMIGVRGRTILLEIKTVKGELTTDQKLFHMNWPGQVAVVRSLEEALKVIERETT